MNKRYCTLVHLNMDLVAFEPTSEGRIPDSKYQYSLVYNIISEIYSEICSSSGSERSII